MSDFSFKETLDHGWRLAIAHSFTGLLLLLGLVSFSVPYAGAIKPFFLLIIVYYWAVYKPSITPVLLIFFIGVLYDLVAGMPYVGFSALLLLALQYVVKDQRLYLMGQPFLMVWLGFAVTALVASFMIWMVHSLLSFQIIAFGPLLIAAIINILIFPAFAWVLGLINRLLPRSGR